MVKNHYHFILKPLVEKAIERFMQKLGTSYTMYFNQKYDRTGALFQGRYKSVHIKTSENLLRLSAYVNANIEIHKITKAQNWIWSSYLDYLNFRKGIMCEKADILSQFESVNEYKEFTQVIINDSQDSKSDIKNYLE